MKIAFYTLGCKTNQYETQAMERLLCEQGHEICSFEDDCDCYIVNTCSVTAVADKKNRAIIRRCRREHPQAILGVCGCYSQHAAQAVRELEADGVGGSSFWRTCLPPPRAAPIRSIWTTPCGGGNLRCCPPVGCKSAPVPC